MRLRIFSGLMVFLALILAGAIPPLAAQSKDRIVAVVNGEVITLKQLDGRIKALTRGRQLAGAELNQARTQVLDGLIEQELMNQAAKAKGVFVTESDVSQAMEAIKQENNLSDEQFRASLAQSGTTVEAFRDDLRIELLRNRVLGAQVMSKIVITDKEVRAFLRGEGPDLSAMTGGSNDIRPIRVIALPLDEKNPQKTMNEAKRIKREIEDGLSFAEAAKKYSFDKASRDNGGDRGDGATVANLHPQMQALVANLSGGQPSEPLAVENAVIILSVVGNPPSQETAPADTNKKKKKKGKDDPNEFTEEAMESGRRQLERYKMQERYAEWTKDLKRNAIIRNNLHN